MKATQLQQLLQFSIANNLPILVKGKPGIGKSDIIEQACIDAGADLIISHPVVSDPTDFKGLPFASVAPQAVEKYKERFTAGWQIKISFDDHTIASRKTDHSFFPGTRRRKANSPDQEKKSNRQR